MYAGQFVLRVLIHFPSHQNLIRAGSRLSPGSGIYDVADRGQVAMRAAELAEAELTCVDANANPEVTARKSQPINQALALDAPTVLNIARRTNCADRMISVLDGKIEDCHYSIS